MLRPILEALLLNSACSETVDRGFAPGSSLEEAEGSLLPFSKDEEEEMTDWFFFARSAIARNSAVRSR